MGSAAVQEDDEDDILKNLTPSKQIHRQPDISIWIGMDKSNSDRCT